MKTVIAGVLSVVLLVGLPLAGAAGGGYAVYALTGQTDEPAPDEADGERRCGMWGVLQLFTSIGTGLVGLAAAGVGLAVGVAVALPAVKVLSEWSTNGPLADDDEADE